MSNYYYMWPCGVWSAQQCDQFWVLGGGIPVKVDPANDTSAFESCVQSNGVTLLYKICKVNGYAPAPSLCALLIPQSWFGAAYTVTELIGPYDDCDGCANAPAPQPASHAAESSGTTTSSTTTSSTTTSSDQTTASSTSTTSGATAQGGGAITHQSSATTQSSSTITATQSSTTAAQSSSTSSSAAACCAQTHNWLLGNTYDVDNVVRRIV